MKIVRAITVLIIALMLGCATTYMNVLVTKPAKVDLSGIEQIAIGEIAGTGAANIADELTMKLFQSGRYKVLDRKHLDQILQEHDLQYSNLVDPNSTVELGKLMGSAALIFGRVGQYNYNEELTHDDFTDKNGRSHRSYTRKGTATVAMTLQITDLKSGEIIAIRNISKSASAKKHNTDNYPESIDSSPLLAKAQSDAIDEFMRDIAPYQVREQVTLLTDDKIPELKQGVVMAKIGDWNGAMQYFYKASKSSPTSSKAFFNLGVAYEYTYQFDEAIECFKMAYQLEQKSVYMNEIGRCQRLKVEHQQLQKQLKKS